VFKLIDRVTRPKNSPGVQFGHDIVVLARVGKKELWWHPGCTITYSVICRDYIPAHLVLVQDGEERWRGRNHHLVYKDVFEGGRLSKKRLAGHAEVIDKFFGLPGLAAALDPRFTLTAEPPDLPS
jgi:hypothetical protein